MNRIDRLLGILTTLQSKKYVPAEKLATKFNISVRTVYRDIKALCELGIPVSFEQPKGYFVVQGYFLPPVSFSTDEANALLLIEAIVQGFADKSIQTHYGSVINKVKAVLKSSQKETVDELSTKIKWQLPACANQNFAYLSVIQNAIVAKHLLTIDYKNAENIVSHRRIEPIGLIFYAFNWHVIAWCHKRHEYRDFKVARIQHLITTGEPFLKTTHIELNEYMSMLPVSY